MVGSYAFLVAFFIGSFVALILGLYVLRNNLRKDIGEIFMRMIVGLQFWFIGLAIATIAPTVEMAIIWRRIASIGWGALPSFILHFFLMLTGKDDLLKKPWIYIVIYGPAFINLFTFTIPTGINPIPYQLVNTSLGWINVAENNMWDWFFYIHYSIYIIAGMTILFLWGKNSLDNNVKKQSGLIIKSFILALVLSTITDVSLNAFSIRLPQIAPIIMLIPITAFSYSIKKYGMIRTNNSDINEVIISEEVLTKILNYLFLIFLSGGLVNITYQYIIYQEGTILSVVLFSIFLILVGILSKILSYLKMSNAQKENVLAIIFYIIIPIMTLRFIEYGSITIWAATFILIIISLLFNHHTILLSISLSALFTQAFISSQAPSVMVEVNEADYILRIFLLVVAMVLSYNVNRIYVARLRDNSYQMRFQNLLSCISYEFVSVNESNFNIKIYDLLKDIGFFIQVDGAYTILLNQESSSIDYKCEWIKNNKEDLHNYNGYLEKIAPWQLEEICCDSIVEIPDIELNHEIEERKKNQLKSQDICSLITIPIKSNSKIVGYLGFNSSKCMSTWNLKQTTQLQIIANIISDAYIKIENEKKINFMAYYDQLTKLPNRILFKDRAIQAINLAKRNEKLIGVAFIDLDSFKSINDTFGHELGDGLLVEVAETISGCLRSTDAVSRFGGDEYIVLLNNISSTYDVSTIMDKIMNLFNHPIILKEQEVFITASVGIALFPKDGEDVDTLIKNADIAMYNSKSLGKNRYTYCSTDMKDEVIEKMKLTNLLYRAQEREQLLLYYQPQICLAKMQIIGLEALARWDLPEWGMVPPSKFIPLAEGTGLINSIGEWILRKACQQNKLWQEMGFNKVRVAVNVSINQLRNPRFVSLVDNILKDTKLEPKYLELEITESIASSQTDNFIDMLNNLKKLGVSISIDDFGTEYSSLSRLKMIPIDRIKMDMQFVQGIEGSDKDQAITKIIINLAKSLNLKVIAEGVETMPQFDFLNQKMCDEVQGYYFYKPMPAEEIAKILHKDFSK